MSKHQYDEDKLGTRPLEKVKREAERITLKRIREDQERIQLLEEDKLLETKQEEVPSKVAEETKKAEQKEETEIRKVKHGNS
jgi:hypothetical protein